VRIHHCILKGGSQGIVLLAFGFFICSRRATFRHVTGPMELIMSLAARKSDLKNHLSRSTKKHLNPSPSASFPEAPMLNESRIAMAADPDPAVAKIDLGERPPRGGTDMLGGITHRI